jgi:hypothetical protein
MAMSPTEIARRVGGIVELRATPLRVRWELGEASARDGHVVTVVASAMVSAVDSRADRQMLIDALLTERDAATSQDVAEYLGPSLRDTAQRSCAKQTVEEILADAGQRALSDALLTAAKAQAFVSGLEIAAPMSVTLDSPSLRRQQAEEAARQAAARRAQAQLESLQRAGGLLKEFVALRQSMPDASAGVLLNQLDPAARSTVLTASLGADTTDARQLYAIGGNTLLKIDPRAASPAISTITIPENLGPLRSVCPAHLEGKRVLLVGAQRGVHVLSLDGGAPTPMARVSEPEIYSELGFNGATIINGELWASHGEAGVIVWKLETPDAPSRRWKPNHPAVAIASLAPTVAPGSPNSPSSMLSAVESARGPRNLCTLPSGRVLYSVGGEVREPFAATDTLPSLSADSAIRSLLRFDDRLVIVRSTGAMQMVDASTLQILDSQRPTGRIASAGVLPWLGSGRILLCGDDGPIQCIGPDDGLVTQYQSNHVGLRSLSAAADVIVAMTSDRQRLILWRASEGKKPIAEIHAYGIARHRIADITFA